MIGNKKQIINWLLNQEENTYEIKLHKGKRSLNANSYFYVLQNKLADVLKVDNNVLHFELLKQYSDVTLVTLPKNSNINGLIKYYEVYKEGKIKGNDVIIYKVYRRSSEMDTKQFSRLLDGIIYECKQVGIEVMTPNELAQLEGYAKFNE